METMGYKMVEINRNETQTIGTSASVISKQMKTNNSTRSSIIIINTSTGGQTISLGIGQEAVSLSGIPLSPGGVWADSRDGIYLPTQEQITAISSAAGGTIAIQERLIQ